MNIAERVQFIVYKDQRVLVLDFTGCTPEEVKSVSDQAMRVITAQPENSVLVLADFTGAQLTKDAANRIKEVTTYDRPYVKRAAWIGAETLPKVLYEAIKTFSQREFPTFPTRQQALDYLVQE